MPRQKPKALSTDAALAGGPARSSCEAPARWGGGGAKGPAHQECSVRSTGALVLGGSEENMPKPEGQAVRDSQADGVGGVSAGCGQQGCPGSGRAGAGRVRGRSEGQPLQDLESDELGVLLSAPGQGGGDPQAARRRGPSARRAHDRRQGRSNGGGHVFGDRWWSRGSTRTPMATGRASRPMDAVGACRRAVLGVRLDHRFGCPEVLRHGAVGPRGQGGARRSPTAAGCCCM